MSKFLVVITNYACNNNCDYCYTQSSAPVDDLHTYIPVTDELFNVMNQYDFVNINGGEPTLHPDILKIASNEKVISINTNLLNADTGVIDKIIAANPKIRINTSYPNYRRGYTLEQIEPYLVKYKDRIKCFCYVAFLKKYSSILSDMATMKSYYGENGRIDPILWIEDGDLDYVKSLSPTERNLMKNALVSLFGNNIFAKKSAYDGMSPTYIGPDSYSTREMIVPSLVKSRTFCNNCGYMINEQFYNCQHCIDYYGKKEFSKDTQSNYIKVITQLKILLGL